MGNKYRDVIQRECPICKKIFIIEDVSQNTRKYCFECSPIGRAGNYTPLFHAMKEEVIRERGGKCECCGYNKSFCALCFHHRDPNEKEFNLCTKSGSCHWGKFYNESRKCDILCLNCHAEEHERLRGAG